MTYSNDPNRNRINRIYGPGSTTAWVIAAVVVVLIIAVFWGMSQNSETASTAPGTTTGQGAPPAPGGSGSVNR